MRHIMVPLTGTVAETHVPLGAMTLARRLRAHVDVASVVSYRAVPYDIGGTAVAPSYYEEVARAYEKLRLQGRTAARAAFDEAVKITKLPLVNHPTCGQASTWYGRAAEGESLLEDIGQLSDLVVVGRPGGAAYGPQLEIIETALFALRRPLLLLPFKVDEIGASLAVAWNGSLEASNALQASLGLMTTDAKITLIQAGVLAEGVLPVEAAAEYLGWHGHQATIRRVDDAPKATAKIIMNEAKAAGADVLVMGAYSHSRLREMFLGGVTATILEHAELPILMAH